MKARSSIGQGFEVGLFLLAWKSGNQDARACGGRCVTAETFINKYPSITQLSRFSRTWPWILDYLEPYRTLWSQSFTVPKLEDV